MTINNTIMESKKTIDNTPTVADFTFDVEGFIIPNGLGTIPALGDEWRFSGHDAQERHLRCAAYSAGHKEYDPNRDKYLQIWFVVPDPTVTNLFGHVVHANEILITTGNESFEAPATLSDNLSDHGINTDSQFRSELTTAVLKSIFADPSGEGEITVTVNDDFSDEKSDEGRSITKTADEWKQFLGETEYLDMDDACIFYIKDILPVCLFEGLSEGDSVSCLVPATDIGSLRDKHDERQQKRVMIKLNITLAQSFYRYRRFGKFEEVLANLK